jgi:hypothetical protein
MTVPITRPEVEAEGVQQDRSLRTAAVDLKKIFNRGRLKARKTMPKITARKKTTDIVCREAL